MTQRTLAGLLAVPLVVALWVVVLVQPLPYVTYRPGPTVDVLAEQEGEEIVQVRGERTYRDGGELRMTTVYVNAPEERVGLPTLIEAWWRDDHAVRPYDSVYAPGETDEDKDVQSAVQMVTSQDVAVATALGALDYDVAPVVKVQDVSKDAPASGRLRVEDVLLEVDGTVVESAEQVGRIVRATPTGEDVEFLVARGGDRRTVRVTPVEDDGAPRVGIIPGLGYDFPFEVDVTIPDSIGGPSAGLMFSLAIYDTLTPGSLTGDGIVSGTGTMGPDGAVGPIGGIQQKVVGADRAGSDVFLVPRDNCAEAVGAPVDDDLRLVSVATFGEALQALETWAADPDAALPTCEEDS